MQAIVECMSSMGIMMSGMAIVGVIGFGIVALVAAAAVKYLFFSRRTASSSRA
ncbi:MAG: hypothetical protein AB7F94_09110 [Nitrospira sp.]